MKTTLRLWTALGLVLALSACGGGGDGGAPPPPPPDAPTADVTVTVADTLGRFVDGVSVSVASTGVAATTDAGGHATLKVPVGSEQLLQLGKSGFAEQVRLLNLDAAARQGALTTLLVAREPAVAIPTIEAGGSAAGKHGVRVEFPAGALVTAAGQPVTGSIDMLMTPLDISGSDIGAFPGAFEGTAAGVARSAIVSLGTAEMVPQQGGAKLQLATGKTATIELPMYASTRFDGTPLHVGDSVPFWSLDVHTGLWLQEGTGTVVAQPLSPTGLALRAVVSHFSWWNVDQFAQRATVNLTVTAPGQSVPPSTLVTVQASLVSGTGPSSAATVGVIVGTAQALTISAPATFHFSTHFDLGALTCDGTTDVSVADGDVAPATIAASCVEVPVPSIVTPTATAATNGSAPTRVQIVVSGPTPDSVELLANGAVVASFAPQFFYVDLLDTSALPEGSTSLQARATLRGGSRLGNAVDLVIDRTAPQVTGISPPGNAPVSRGTVLTVSFSEPVNAFPLTLADAVVFTVTPTGTSTPIPVAADIALDTAGLTLTATPREDLPPGIAGLSWGRLADAAGNAVTGTVAATWAVDQSLLLGPALDHQQGNGDNVGPSIAIAPDGSVYALHRPTGTGAFSLSRFDPTTQAWVVLANPLNERPTRNLVTLAVDSAGVPWMAFAQETAADPHAFELVLKRFNGVGLERAAPAVAVNGSAGGLISQGSLAIDASNRPVLTFTDAFNSDVLVYRLESGALVQLADVATLAFDPHLALQADGTPLVAYLQGVGGSNAASLRVVAVVGGVPQALGGAIDGTFDATQSIGNPRVIVSSSGPWVFWIKNGLGHAARFDGTNWTEAPFPAPLDAITLAAAVLGGDPVVIDGQIGSIQAWRFRAGAWELPFDASGRADHQDHIDVAVRGTTVDMISSSGFRNEADAQQLIFP